MPWKLVGRNVKKKIWVYRKGRGRKSLKQRVINIANEFPARFAKQQQKTKPKRIESLFLTMLERKLGAGAFVVLA